MAGNYIISNICQVRLPVSTAGRKKGFSFSLFMGARRQFEEMPNKKVKSGELRNKNLAITARAQVKRRETSKDYCYSEIEIVMFLPKS